MSASDKISCFRCEVLDGDADGRTCWACRAIDRSERRIHFALRENADRYARAVKGAISARCPDASRYTGRPRLVAGKPFGSE